MMFSDDFERRQDGKGLLTGMGEASSCDEKEDLAFIFIWSSHCGGKS